MHRIKQALIAAALAASLFPLQAAERRTPAWITELSLGAFAETPLLSNAAPMLELVTISPAASISFETSILSLGAQVRCMGISSGSPVFPLLLTGGIADCLIGYLGWTPPTGRFTTTDSDGLTLVSTPAGFLNSYGFEVYFLSLKLDRVVLKASLSFLSILTRSGFMGDSSGSVSSISLKLDAAWRMGTKPHSPKYGLLNLLGIPLF